MTPQRSSELQGFLGALKTAFAAAPDLSPVALAFTITLFETLSKAGARGNEQPATLPVCDQLPSALQAAKSFSPEIAQLSTAFEKITPHLSWKLRASGGPNASASWPDGHANVMIIGKGGLEEREDVAIGASLLAPRVRYPDHSHPPEELYMILSPGRFQHGRDDWCEPGPGGTFHNPPAIQHAMASGDAPLLAIWTLIVS